MSLRNGADDWQIVRSDGAITLDVRLALQTTDGALIVMTCQGIRHGPADLTPHESVKSRT